MNAVDSNRLQAWQALSQFFLDTEVDQATFNHVAKEIMIAATRSPRFTASFGLRFSRRSVEI
jgi:hypothetical protein